MRARTPAPQIIDRLGSPPCPRASSASPTGPATSRAPRARSSGRAARPRCGSSSRGAGQRPLRRHGPLVLARSCRPTGMLLDMSALAGVIVASTPAGGPVDGAAGRRRSASSASRSGTPGSRSQPGRHRHPADRRRRGDRDARLGRRAASLLGDGAARCGWSPPPATCSRWTSDEPDLLHAAQVAIGMLGRDHGARARGRAAPTGWRSGSSTGRWDEAMRAARRDGRARTATTRSSGCRPRSPARSTAWRRRRASRWPTPATSRSTTRRTTTVPDSARRRPARRPRLPDLPDGVRAELPRARVLRAATSAASRRSPRCAS